MYLDGANSILACFFVLIGLDQQEDWPSLFGNPASATCLRKFCTRFWHRLAIRPYTNYGKIIARACGMQPPSIAYNMTLSFIAFGLSGLTHAAVSWQLGRLDVHLVVRWFFLNFAACSIEVSFQSAIRMLAKRSGWARELKLVEESWLGTFIGYTWVLAFFFWSVPKWRYPRMYDDARRIAVLRSLLSKMSIVPPSTPTSQVGAW